MLELYISLRSVLDAFFAIIDSILHAVVGSVLVSLHKALFSSWK